MKKKIIVILVAAFAFAAGGYVFANGFMQLDFVNIGTDTNHSQTGWGPVEPDAHGGNWGNISGEASCDLPSSLTCDKKTEVTYAADEPDDPDSINEAGRSAYVTLDPKASSKWGEAKSIKMRVLDGVANDDFLVFVKDRFDHYVLIYEYKSDPATTEYWKVHNIDLSGYPNISKRKKLEIRIMAAGSDWELKKTYGQLAVDWIILSGKKITPCFVCDD